MNEGELQVEVVDRRLQVDLDEEQGISPSHKNSMPEQGFESRAAQEEEEEQQQEPHFKLQKLLPKQNQKQRLIEQNIKLKTQIYELAKQLDEILIKDKGKKKNYGIGLKSIDEEEQLVRQRRLQLQRQQIQLSDMKHRIFIAKRQLESVYNDGNITIKEDENKNLKAQLKILEEEKKGHLNIQKGQSSALKVVKNEEEYSQKIRNVVSECSRLKKQSKQLIQKINNSEKVLMRIHDSHVGKRESLRDIEMKLALNKEKEKAKSKKQNETVITEEMIDALESQIRKMEQDRKEGQKSWQDKIKAVDTELIIKRAQQERKLLLLREKQRELKINQLKIRELRKMIRQKDEAVSQARRTAQDMDMSQFRHKRNIRYLDK